MKLQFLVAGNSGKVCVSPAPSGDQSCGLRQRSVRAFEQSLKATELPGTPSPLIQDARTTTVSCSIIYIRPRTPAPSSRPLNEYRSSCISRLLSQRPTPRPGQARLLLHSSCVHDSTRGTPAVALARPRLAQSPKTRGITQDEAWFPLFLSLSQVFRFILPFLAIFLFFSISVFFLSSFLVFFSVQVFLFFAQNVSFVPLMSDSKIQRQLHSFQHLQFDILLFSFPLSSIFFSSFYLLPFHHHLHPSASVFFSSPFLLSRAIFQLISYRLPTHFFHSPLFLFFHLFRSVAPHPILQLPLIHFFLSLPRVFILPLIFNPQVCSLLERES